MRAVVESAYGHGAGDIFLAAAPFALIALIAVTCFIKEVAAAASTTANPGFRPRSSGNRPVAAGAGARRDPYRRAEVR